MVDYKYKDLFLKSHIDKQLKIATDNGLFTATNEDIHFEDFELTESLCSDSELRFGSCEASMVKFQIRNAFIPLAGKWLTVTETLEGNTDVPFRYGRYKVFSDVPTADKEYRDIVAYDAMYDILGADMAAWYNALLPNKDSTVTLKQFRESFIAYFGLNEVAPDDGLVNDNMTVERTIKPEEISGKDIITAICEINGCFGHIGRDGKFHYVYLPQDIQGIYPADFLFPDHVPAQWDYLPQAETGHLYPQDPKGERMGAGRYIKCQYEDYVVRQINKVQIRKEENDIGAFFPKTNPSPKDNSYIIEDNFLVYGKSTEELEAIAENVYKKIRGIVYRPFNAECPGNPCFEIGDPLRFLTKYALVESYILSRTLKGIQSLRDNYSSKGLEQRSQNANGIRKSIIQLKGKANILTRTIEETKLEMYDIEAELSNTITITAQDIRAELKNTADGLTNTINITASQIRTELQNTKEGLESSISQTASQIRTEVNNTRENLQSQITQNAGEIDLRVKKDGVIASINLSPENITLQANRIDLNGLVNAAELTTKFATISTLNATTASLNNVIAQKATIDQLNVTNARIENLEVDHVSINSFNAANANLENLISKKIDASTVKADYMEVANWTSAGYIRADRIETNSLSIGSDQITGTTRIRIPQSFERETINYVDPQGNSHSISVLSHVSSMVGLKVLAAD